MEKVRISMNYITRNYKKVFACDYCDLQYIFNGISPQFYNSGLYGWNCDIYIDYKRDIAITTGYRNMRGDMIPYEIIEKYSNIAKEILSNYSVSYDKRKEKLDKNRENFLNEIEEYSKTL